MGHQIEKTWHGLKWVDFSRFPFPPLTAGAWGHQTCSEITSAGGGSTCSQGWGCIGAGNHKVSVIFQIHPGKFIWNTADVPDSKWVTFEFRHQPLNFRGVWPKFQVWEQWMIHTLAGWWLNQPIWKICSSKWVHLPHFSGWNRKYVRNHHPAKIRHGVWNFDWISVKKPGRGTNSRADRWGSSHPNHRKGGWGEANVQNEGLIHWLSKLTDKSHSNLQID